MKKLLSAAALALLTTAALPASAASREVIGRLMFQDGHGRSDASLPYQHNGYRPIRNVTVHLKVNGQTVGSAVTNSAGDYSVFIDQSKLPVGQTLTVEYESRNYAADVKLDLDGTDDRLVFSNSVEIPHPQWLIYLDDTVTFAEFSQHFSILDAILYGRQYADSRREDTDDIGSVEVEYPDAAGTFYNGDDGFISVAGPAAYGYGWTGGGPDSAFFDTDILHEYGHHLMHEMSDGDGPGGNHGLCTDRGYEFGWSEGWATFFAESVDATWPDAFAPEPGRDYEGDHGCSSPSAEAVTTTILWDLFDGLGEGFDRIDGGYVGNEGKPIRDTLFGVVDVEQDDRWGQYYDPPTNILGFHDHLVARDLYAGAHADVDRVYYWNGVFPHAPSDFSVSSITPAPTSVVAGGSVNLTMTLANTGGVAYLDEDLVAIVSVWPSGGTEQHIDAFLAPSSMGEQVVSRSVTIPSNLPAGTQFVFVRLDPHDRFPETNESNNVLAVPVEVLTCGNRTCDAGETCSTCPRDCGRCGSGRCGDAICGGGETCSSCSRDCGRCVCGNGVCEATESPYTCPRDCQRQ